MTSSLSPVLFYESYAVMKFATVCFFFVMTAFLSAQTPVEVGGLKFTPPKGWQPVETLSPLRAAQWSIPPPRGAEEIGEVVAFYFGPGQGGDTKANLDRWLTTMTTPEGTPASASSSVRKVGDLTVTQIIVFGTYANSMATPGVPAQPKRNYGLIGAIVDRPEQGSIFFRLVGPEALVKAQLVNFTKFVDSMKPGA